MPFGISAFASSAVNFARPDVLIVNVSGEPTGTAPKLYNSYSIINVLKLEIEQLKATFCYSGVTPQPGLLVPEHL